MSASARTVAPMSAGNAGTRSAATAAAWVSGEPERLQLDATSWVDVFRGWMHSAPGVFDDLARDLPWQQGRTWRYDHYVPENRLHTSAAPNVHPALLAAHKALRNRYGVEFERPSLCFYQHGGHAMGAHRDREMRWLEDTVIGILSLGVRRPFLLIPRSSRRDGPRQGIDIAPGNGDLLVMGGRAQADWLHAVPPAVTREARISVQWRWTSRRGRPEKGPGYYAPRHYGRS